MFKKILIFIVVIAAIVLGFMAYSGFFTKVVIVEKEVGPYVFVGKEYVGDYRTTGMHQDSIYKDLISKKLDVTEGFGIYRDNPEKVQPDKCRFMVGCVLPDKDTVRSGELEREGYIIQRMNVTNSMFVEFPFRTPISVIASVIRVYPALRAYMKKNHYKEAESLEIYTQDKILISMEIKE